MTPVFREVDGAVVRLLWRPSTGGPSVVLLHGYPDTCDVFRPLAQALPASWGLVGPDFPGQGGSRARADLAHPKARAGWCLRLFESLDVERPMVFGHDMGGHTALELAHTTYVSGVVLSHCLLDGQGPTSPSIQWLRASRAYRLLLPVFSGLVFSRCLATFFEGPVPMDSEIELMRQAFLAHGARATVEVCDAAEVWLTESRREPKVPTVALWSKHERHFPLAQLAAFPTLQRRVVDRGGHWLVWEQPALVAEVLASLGAK